MLKNIINKKLIIIISIITLILIQFFNINQVYGFSDEEQEIINTNVEKMKEGSKNIGCKYNLTDETNSIYFTSTDTIAGVKCNYVALMYWNNQFQITLTDDVITAKCVWFNTHALVAFMYDSDFNCIGYYIYNLPENDSITISKVNGYFKSTFTVKNSSGQTVDPFFPSPPQEITGVLVAETGKAQIMEQIKTMIVGFLKYLIVLVISVIAFYKGWKFLLTQLRKS